MDPRGYVRPGDRLRVAASQINALNAMMRPDVGFQAESLTGYGPLNTIILARNSTGSTVARWGAMKITGVVVNPNDGDPGRRSFEAMPCVVGGIPTGDIGSTFVIAVEPIKNNSIGRVAVAGVVQVTAATLSLIRPHVHVLWEDADWGLVRIDGSPVRLGKTTAAWDKGTLATITLYDQGEPPSEYAADPPNTLAGCVNKTQNVPANKFVMLGRAANGHYYLIDAECG